MTGDGNRNKNQELGILTEEKKKKNSLWRKLREKYRISVLDERTLTEHLHVQLNGWIAIVVAAMLFLLTLGLFSLVILYTPVKNYLPGYSEDIRQQLIVESARMDSLNATMELHRQYLGVIKQVMTGEVHTDTVQSLDSMYIITREQLLEAKSEATEEFIAQYEAKEKDNLQLFYVANTIPVLSFFRPAHGVILQSYSEQEKRYGVLIQTPENENVTAVLSGTVMYVNYEIGNTYSMMVQHTNYLSIYRNITKVLKKKGDVVQAGESIAIMDKLPLEFELWQNGKPINPEEVIAF
jgi:murein DD-endopeptidase MepM/ murein hydrolase activator NlpD